MVSIGAEPCNMPTGARCHPGDKGIGGVEHSPTVNAEGLNDLTLSLGNDLSRTKLAQVGIPDVEDHGYVGSNDGGEPGDMTQTASPHFRHQERGVLVTAARRQRNSDFIVERPHRSHRWAKSLKDLGQHVLGACLTAGTSHSDGTHATFSFSRHDMTRQSR